MLTDVLIVLALVLLNGVFAMSEIAIVSSRRARLLQMADAGGSGAQYALKLASEPTRFLSSVQIGITSIGILNGAIGEASIARRLGTALEQVPVLAPYAGSLSLIVMVVLLTYVSLFVTSKRRLHRLVIGSVPTKHALVMRGTSAAAFRIADGDR